MVITKYSNKLHDRQELYLTIRKEQMSSTINIAVVRKQQTLQHIVYTSYATIVFKRKGSSETIFDINQLIDCV